MSFFSILVRGLSTNFKDFSTFLICYLIVLSATVRFFRCLVLRKAYYYYIPCYLVMSGDKKVERFGVSIPLKLLEEFDKKIEEKMYANRSEAVRDLVRDFVTEEELDNPGADAIGALTLIYGHEKKGISDKLTELQHSEISHIISSMHVHLDKHNCMEILALEGKAKDIRKTADMLKSTKGVKHGELTLTTL